MQKQILRHDSWPWGSQGLAWWKIPPLGTLICQGKVPGRREPYRMARGSWKATGKRGHLSRSLPREGSIRQGGLCMERCRVWRGSVCFRDADRSSFWILSTTNWHCSGCLSSACTRITSCAMAAAFLQHPLKEFRVESRNEVLCVPGSWQEMSSDS